MNTSDRQRKPYALSALACLAAVAGLMLCSSCSTPPAQDEGLVGIIYHAATRADNRNIDGRKMIQPRVAARVTGPQESVKTSGAAPAATAAVRQDAPETNGPAEGPPSYRLSPGDVLAVSYFARPPGDMTEYLVDSQDVLTISVAGQQTFSGDVVVRPDGCISFFLVGELRVRGLTVPKVREAIVAKMAAVMAGAEITVILKEGNALAREFLNTLRSNTDLGSTRIIQVRHDGMVTFPLVGEVSVMGKTLQGLSQDIDAKYNTVFRKGIAIALNLSSSSDGNIAVLGEVRNPGRYTINNPVSPFFALAMAGGALDTAKQSQVVVVNRSADGRVGWHVINLDIGSGKPLGPEIALGPQDMLLVPKTGIANLNVFVDQYIRRAIPLSVGYSSGPWQYTVFPR